MNTQQLKYFLKLAETERLTLTADSFYISAPALRATINRLEDEFATELFRRSGRNIELTPQGQILFRYAKEMMQAYDGALAAIQSHSKQEASSVSLGITSPAIWHSAMETFVGLHPEITLSHTLLTLEQLKNPAAIQNIDLIITASCDEVSGAWDSALLEGSNLPCLVVYPGHRFCGRKQIRLIEAKDERFIRITKGSSFRAYTDKLFRLAGFVPNTSVECEYSLRKVMIAARYGIAVSTKSVVESGMFGDVQCLEITEPKLTHTHSIFWRKDVTLKPPVARFKDFIMSAV